MLTERYCFEFTYKLESFTYYKTNQPTSTSSSFSFDDPLNF